MGSLTKIPLDMQSFGSDPQRQSHTHLQQLSRAFFWSLVSFCFVLTTYMIYFSDNCHHISKHLYFCNIQALRLTNSPAFLPAFAGKFSWESLIYNNISWPYTPRLIFRVQTRFRSLCMCHRWRWGVVSTVYEAVHADSSRLAALHAEPNCLHGSRMKRVGGAPVKLGQVD